MQTTQAQTIVTKPMADISVEAQAQIARLTEAMNNFVVGLTEIAKRTHGEAQRLADVLTTEFGAGWYDRMDDKSDEGKLLRGFKKALFGKLNQAGHSNPSMQWKRVMEKAGKPEGTKAQDSEGTARPLDMRLVEEISKLVKAINKDDNASVNALKANKHLIDALQVFGVKVED